ncbi:Alpha-protein kinase 2 [Pleurotus pulmonarius]|nr:Alpha-protein kinase 2 [Pleurotus pulmonarius]
MVNAAQRKGSSQAQCVAQHLPLPSPAILQPNIQVPRRSGTSGMMPAGLPIGYSSAHVQHAAATTQWRSSAYAPGDRCQILMQVHYEVRPTKTLNSRPVDRLKAYLSEGRSIPAALSGNQIAELALSHMFGKLVEATTNGFQWDKSQIKVRDQQWNDLTNLDEEGHFGKSCFKLTGRDKKQIFSNPRNPFLVLLVIDRTHYEEYENFADTFEIEEASSKAAASTSPRKGKGKKNKAKAKTQYDSTINESCSKENGDDAGEPVRLPLAFTEFETETRTNGKRQRVDSLTRPETPPRNKRAHIYISPDRQGLRAAMKHAGSARNLSGLGSGERVEYSPIKVPTFHELIKSQSGESPTWACSPNLVRQGSLYSMAQLGIGTFKTCHTGRLILHPGRTLDNDLLGTLGTEDVAIKRVYLPSKEASSSSTRQIITRYGASDERQKTLMEATLLCWATSLLMFGYSFIDTEILALKECAATTRQSTTIKKRLRLLGELEPTMPRLRFVRGGIATTIGCDSIASSATRTRLPAAPTTITYLLEEKIPSAAGFAKYINNGSAKPLVNDVDDPDFATSLFLCCMQHILYSKSGGQLYISDFQGGGNLLSDPQIMTSAEYGFGDGNVSYAFKDFPSQHECNDYCHLFGLDDLRSAI